MIEYRIWVVDDESSIRDGISLALGAMYKVEVFSTGEEALDTLKNRHRRINDAMMPDLVLLDLGLPGMHGLEVHRHMREIAPGLLMIIISAYEDSRTIITAMKQGAHDYIIKPILMPALRVTIRNALETIHLKKEIRNLQDRYLNENFPCFVGDSDSIQNLMSYIGRVAASPDTPVLILGETGTGKELVANAIHSRSPHFQGPFVAMNCAAIPEQLVESELFGYEKGAFTGAETTKKGLVEAADGGTLFLDEIGDLGPDAQAKLLRFLDSGEFYRVGGIRARTVNTRIISATNRSLEEMMDRGGFRRDLYFRLSVVSISLPSLNERREDIIAIARYFLDEFNGKFDRRYTGFTPVAEAELKAHQWVGNVRELRNCVERAVLLGQNDPLGPEDLGLLPGGPAAPDTENFLSLSLPEEGMDMPGLLESIKIRLMTEALKRSGGNEAAAARLLGIKAHTLRYQMAKRERESIA